MGLVTREYGPNAKGRKLTVKEMDDNLLYLESLILNFTARVQFNTIKVYENLVLESLLTGFLYVSEIPEGGLMITLPFPGNVDNGTFIIIKDGSGTASINNITVNTIDPDIKIDGETSYNIASNLQTLKLVAYDGNYHIV